MRCDIVSFILAHHNRYHRDILVFLSTCTSFRTRLFDFGKQPWRMVAHLSNWLLRAVLIEWRVVSKLITRRTLAYNVIGTNEITDVCRYTMFHQAYMHVHHPVFRQNFTNIHFSFTRDVGYICGSHEFQAKVDETKWTRGSFDYTNSKRVCSTPQRFGHELIWRGQIAEMKLKPECTLLLHYADLWSYNVKLSVATSTRRRVHVYKIYTTERYW